MGEVGEDIAVVQACHRDFGDDHLKKRGEGGEDTKLPFLETKTGGSTEVATLHDPRWDEDFGVLLMDGLQTGRALQITCLTT